MKKFLYFMAAGLLLCLCLPVSAATSGSRTVTTGDQLRSALADTSVDTIILGGSIDLLVSGNGDNLFHISRPVTIQGASASANLSMRYAGIVLGADVTFKNMTLEFPNPVRNAIIANGHTLTLDGVGRPSSSNQDIHIFCGGITEYTGSAATAAPAPGNHGHVIIKGSGNLLGHVYAGNFSDVSSTGSAVSSTYTGNATITIESGAGGTIGNIYACGAMESRGEGTGNLLYPSGSMYPVMGRVQVNLSFDSTPSDDLYPSGIYGTGPSSGCHVSFRSSSRSQRTGISLDSIAGLSVESGMFEPAAFSSFSTDAPAVSVAEGAYLGLANYGASLSFGDFSGGGILVFAEDTPQSLTISGNVVGRTGINLGAYQAELSWGEPELDHTYINAPASVAGSFRLICNDGEHSLALDEEGAWKAVTGAADGTDGMIYIDSISIPATWTLSSGSSGGSIPVTVTYAQGGPEWAWLFYVPVSISIDGEEAVRTGDDSSGFYYELPQDSAFTSPYFAEDNGSESFCLYSYEDFTPIPDGTYTIVFSIPASYMKSGSSFTHTLTLQVGDPPAEPLAGDVDGDGAVTIGDAVKVTRFSLGLDTPTDTQRSAADMNGDKDITAADVLAICRILVGLSGAE